jgi:hypothetical protein
MDKRDAVKVAAQIVNFLQETKYLSDDMGLSTEEFVVAMKAGILVAAHADTNRPHMERAKELTDYIINELEKL